MQFLQKLVLIIFLGTFAFSFSFSQDAEEKKEEEKAWTKGGMGSLTFNQVGLYNWAAGGNSNMTLIGNLNLFANYKKGNLIWDNNLDLAYGFIQQFKPNTLTRKVPGSRVTKAEDKIDFTSKAGKKAWSDKFYYSGLLNFRTQFAQGFSDQTTTAYLSKFLSPAYLQLAIGLDYKPNDWLSIFFSPISGKITIVGDDSLAQTKAFGVNQTDASGDFLPGNSENMRMEFGATLKAKLKRDIMKNVGFESNLMLFSNYIDRPQNIDVQWSNALVAKVNKYITVNIFTDLIYDHDIKIPLFDGEGDPIINSFSIQKKGPRIQFKEIFGLGFSYKL